MATRRNNDRVDARSAKARATRTSAAILSRRLRVQRIELEPPLPEMPADSTEDTLGVATVLAGNRFAETKVTRGFMEETYGGGGLELVPGYDVGRAMTSGLMHGGELRCPQVISPVETTAVVAVDGLRAESVILDPADTRRQVPNSTVLPWRCIALLNIEFLDGVRARGTGWFIGPRTLVTAAHCVHDPVHGRARSILITPGSNGGTAPYGRFAATGLDFDPGWTRGFPRELDFALLYVAQPSGVGYFGYAAAGDDGLAKVLVNVAGYPIDRPQTQWYDAGRILRVDRDFIYHTIDTESGQSGAPLFWSDRQQRIGLGIHAYGASPSDRTNVARRITLPLYELFEAKKV